MNNFIDIIYKCLPSSCYRRFLITSWASYTSDIHGVFPPTEFNNKTTEHILAAALARHTVFFMPCDMEKMEHAIDAFTKGTTSTGTPTALLQPAALHLISRSMLEPTLDVLRKASMGWGTLIGLHILLGADLPDCGVFLGDTSSHWYQGSYNMVSESFISCSLLFFSGHNEW